NAIAVVPNLTVTYSSAKKQLTVVAPLGRARSYFVAVLGTTASGLKGATGDDVIGSPAFALVRAHHSLVSCLDLGAADCQSRTAFLDSPQKAIALERARRRLQPGLLYLEKQGLVRERLASAWTFRTSS